MVAPKLVKKLPVGSKGINCKTKKVPALKSIKFLAFTLTGQVKAIPVVYF